MNGWGRGRRLGGQGLGEKRERGTRQGHEVGAGAGEGKRAGCAWKSGRGQESGQG